MKAKNSSALTELHDKSLLKKITNGVNLIHISIISDSFSSQKYIWSPEKCFLIMLISQKSISKYIKLLALLIVNNVSNGVK